MSLIAQKGHEMHHLAPATLTAYARGVADLEAHAGAPAATLDSEVVGAWLRRRAAEGVSPASLQVYLQGVRQFIELPTSHTSPMRPIWRDYGRPPRRVRPILAAELARMLKRCPDDQLGLRDAAMLAVGFAGALRRSEICALDVADVESDGAHAILTVRRSKTDQSRRGQTVPLIDGELIHPLRRLEAYLDACGIDDGAIFRGARRNRVVGSRRIHPDTVARAIKRLGAEIGLDAAELSGHSLRSGMITSAAMAGARWDKIADISRHSSMQMLMVYIRDAQRFLDHAGAGVL